MASSQYDVTDEQKKILEEKTKRRAVLRQEFIKQINNPYRHATGEGGTIYDAGMLRFAALKTTGYDHFRPSARNGLNALIFVVIPMFAYGYLLKTERDGREAKYRAGEVAYKDRKFKWI